MTHKTPHSQYYRATLLKRLGGSKLSAIALLSIALIGINLSGCKESQVKPVEKTKKLTIFERLDRDFAEANLRKAKASKWHAGARQALPLTLIGPVFEHPNEKQHQSYKLLSFVLRQLASKPQGLDQIFEPGFSQRYSQVNYQAFNLGSDQTDKIAAAFSHAYRNEVTLNAIFDTIEQNGLEIAISIDQKSLNQQQLRLQGYKTVLEPGFDRNTVFFELNAGKIAEGKKELLEQLYRAVAAALALSIPEYASIDRQKVLDRSKNRYVSEFSGSKTYGHIYNNRIKVLEKEKQQQLTELDKEKVISDTLAATSTAFSIDGNRIAYSTKKKQINKVHVGSASNFEQRKLLLQSSTWDGWTHSLLFNRTGDLFVINNNAIRRHNQQQWLFEIETDESVDASVDREGRLLFVAHEDAIVIYNGNNGEKLNSINYEHATLTQISSKADGRYYASGDDNGSVHVYRSDNNSIHLSKKFNSAITQLHYIGNSQRLLIGLQNGDVHLWDSVKNSDHVLDQTGNEIAAMSIAHKNNRVAIRTRQGLIKQYSLADNRLEGSIQETNLNASKILSGGATLQYSADDEFILYGGANDLKYRRSNTAEMINKRYSKLIKSGKSKSWLDASSSHQHVYSSPLSALDIKRLQQAKLTQVVITEDTVIDRNIAKQLLDVVGMNLPDPMLVASRPEIFQAILNVSSVSDEISRVRLIKYHNTELPAGIYSVSRSRYDDWGYQYDEALLGRRGFIPRAYQSVKEKIMLSDEQTAAGGLLLSEIDQQLYIGSPNSDLIIRDAISGNKVTRFEGHSKPITAIAVHPEGQQILTGGRDGLIKLWNRQTGLLTKTFTGYTGTVGDLLFIDKDTAVSGSADHSIKIWNSKLGKPSRPALLGHTATVTFLAYDPDYQWLISAGDDQSIRIWNSNSGSQLRAFSDLSLSSSVSYDKQSLLVGYQDQANRYTVRSIKNGEIKGQFTVSGNIAASQLLAEGKIALIATNTELAAWATDSGKKLYTLASLGENKVKHIQLSPKQDIAVISRGNNIEWWNIGWFRFQVAQGWQD